jgi:signal transduction histidine kinase
MSMLIRSRLLLLVLAWALPALAALLAVVHFTARSEQQANESALRDTARAMSMVVERELDRRVTVARVLATSRALGALPELSEDDASWFGRQAREAMQGLDGWVEVRDERGVVLDSRVQRGPAAAAAPLSPVARISPLLTDAGPVPHATVTHPVLRQGALVGNIVVVILPSELQRLIDMQGLPSGWVATVLDDRRKVVARQPGGASMLGREATPDLRQHLATKPDGGFESRSLEGDAVTGYFNTSSHGWTYAAAMPRAQFGGYLQGAAAQIIGGALVLLALAVGGALWVSRGIASAVVALKQMAARLEAGQAVQPLPTGIAECDDVAAALDVASRATRGARAELERQVADAVARTRQVEQDGARSQRVAALGRLTGGVAHDFNNLLGVVSNSAHLVQRHLSAQPQLQSPVAAILRAVDVGSRLTQQLLRFAARQPLKPQTLDLGRYMPDLKELLTNVVGKRIGIAVSTDAGTRTIFVDSAELELALINLALNARDAMPDGGTLRVTARNAAAEETLGLTPGDYVAIDVADEGVGIDAALVERIFEPFVTTKPIGEGTGLGLAQVHGFCKQAGGAARIASVPGQGTKATLLVPATTASVPAQAPRAPALPADSLAALRVAVVEDNEALGEATAALLRSHGAAVVRLPDAAAALDAIGRDAGFDVVLTDVMMPGAMDGLSLARELRARTPPVPVVLISGYAPQVEAGHGFTLLQKPTSDEQLIGALLDAHRRVARAR